MNKLLRNTKIFLKFLISVLILPGVLNGFVQPALAASPAAGQTYVVNSTLDTPNADPAAGICTDAQGRCTLRAAIMEANFVKGSNTIILPSGIYLLTRPGYDNGALVGDLDVAGDLTIQGAGSGVTIVDGNGTVTGDRVFKVLSTAQNVTLSGMTIRNGQSITSTVGTIGGGGLYMEGAGHLILSDVILEGNSAINGGAIYANLSTQGGSVDLSHVIMRSNTVSAGGVGAGGGMFATLLSSGSEVSVLGSQVYSNTVDGTGGGFYIQGTDLAHWRIESSEIYSNKAASGGGIGNLLPLTLVDSRLYDNHANFDGGAIEAFSPLAITRSTLSTNTAGRYGGGIFDLATGTGTIYNDFANIEQSTLNGNYAKDGGGIYHDGFINYNSILTLTNSTLSGNVVSRYGGGLNIYNGQAQLFNTTVASNSVRLSFPIPGPGIGAGLYITATSVLTAEDSLIANNIRGNGIIPGVADDCYSSGTTGMLGYDLIRSTTNCFVSGPQIGIISGQDPLLGPLQYNGGSTQTHALLPGSPAIDAGAQTGCMGAGGVPLTTDQRGYPRPIGPACDISAFEYDPNSSTIYISFLQK
jgi:CSLREA domain-containing protein